MSTVALPVYEHPEALYLWKETPPVMELACCSQPDCACRGVGSVTFLTANSLTLLEVHARRLKTEGTCLLTMQVSRSAGRIHKNSATASSVFYREHLLCSLQAAPTGSILAATAAFDLPILRRALLSVYRSSKDQSLLLLHQPAALSPLERHMDETLPRSLNNSPGAVLSQNGMLLLFQPGGWALGDFLAKAALLRQRQRWRVQTAQSDTGPESAVNVG